MIKLIVGLFLIVFDFVISFKEKVNLDLLPDFIGYAIIAYGFYSIRKKSGKNTQELLTATKQGIISAVVVFVMSYVTYLLDMYGVLSGMNKVIIIITSVILDLGLLLIMFMLTQILSALQGKDTNFQVKAMLVLWKVMCLCVACEYISMPVPEVAKTFFVFEKIVAVMYMVYVLTADRTYKKKFMVK